MNEHIILKKIEDTLLTTTSHKDKPDIIFAEIDIGGSDAVDKGVIPYLNLYGYSVLDDENLDSTIDKAIKNDEFGYIIDILDCIIWDDFEIELDSIYPNWPLKREAGDLKIISFIKKIVNENKESFVHVKKLYFHYVDNLDFVKIIDKPA